MAAVFRVRGAKAETERGKVRVCTLVFVGMCAGSVAQLAKDCRCKVLGARARSDEKDGARHPMRDPKEEDE
jgi:hypothetical protein